MLQDTFIPEMDSQSYNSLYSRESQTSVSSGDTLIPNMNNPIKNGEKTVRPNSARNEGQEPVVGFLYSISRRGKGEYWPLHLGANTIGRNDKCDIVLKELSVSENHAVLSVRKMKSSSDVIACIRDNGSKNGMYLNDEELDFENHTCKNGDVITVGSCYQLLLILINTKQYGLSVAENFTPCDEQQEDKSAPVPQPTHRRRPSMDNATVDLGGASPFIGGGTELLS